MKKLLLAVIAITTIATQATAREMRATHTGNSYQNGNYNVCEYKTISGYTFWLTMPRPWKLCKFSVRGNPSTGWYL